MNLNRIAVAENLYTEYCNSVGGKAFNGDPLPTWAEFVKDPAKQKQVLAWLNAASVAINSVACAINDFAIPTDDELMIAHRDEPTVPFQTIREIAHRKQQVSPEFLAAAEDLGRTIREIGTIPSMSLGSVPTEPGKTETLKRLQQRFEERAVDFYQQQENCAASGDERGESTNRSIAIAYEKCARECARAAAGEIPPQPGEPWPEKAV